MFTLASAIDSLNYGLRSGRKGTLITKQIALDG